MEMIGVFSMLMPVCVVAMLMFMGLHGLADDPSLMAALAQHSTWAADNFLLLSWYLSGAVMLLGTLKVFSMVRKDFIEGGNGTEKAGIVGVAVGGGIVQSFVSAIVMLVATIVVIMLVIIIYSALTGKSSQVDPVINVKSYNVPMPEPSPENPNIDWQKLAKHFSTTQPLEGK